MFLSYLFYKMVKISGAGTLARCLKDIGTKTIFGYTGGSILPVFDELKKSGLEIIINANEQCSGFSAAGISRSSDNVGVAVVTSGPAITNALTSIADSNADSIPLIVIAGQVPEHKIGTDSFQNINVQRVFENAAKKVITFSNNQDIESIIKKAYFESKAGKPGPIVIDFPFDKQKREHEYNFKDINLFKNGFKDERHLSSDQCKDFFKILLKSEKPLIYIGGGLNSKKGSESIRKFNDYFKIPVVNTLMSKGVENESRSFNLGMLGMFGTPYANKIIQENDFFFAIGTRWDDRVAEKVGFGDGCEIAYIDINPEKINQINIERSPAFSYIGDASTALEDLLDYAKDNNINLNIDNWREHSIKIKKSWPLDYNRDSDKIQAAEVIDLLSRKINSESKIITGVGNHQMLAAQYFKINNPKSFMTSGSFATMGFALPTSVGVQVANLNSEVYVIDGDGGFKMNLGELNTISSLNLPIKIILINNQADGMVLNVQDSVYNGLRVGTQRNKDINFSNIAKDFDFNYSERVEDKNKLESEINKFILSQGPSLLEIKTQQDEVIYPIVPAGCSYKEMKLGPYIKKVS